MQGAVFILLQGPLPAAGSLGGEDGSLLAPVEPLQLHGSMQQALGSSCASAFSAVVCATALWLPPLVTGCAAQYATIGPWSDIQDFSSNSSVLHPCGARFCHLCENLLNNKMDLRSPEDNSSDFDPRVILSVADATMTVMSRRQLPVRCSHCSSAWPNGSY